MAINIPIKQDPVLFDRIIQQLQEGFKSKLNWLDYAFGRSYCIEEQTSSGIKKYPGVYLADGNYLSVLPDDTLGNFLFFELYDPIKVDNIRNNRLSANGAIIFWLNADTIFQDKSVLYTEDIKLEVLQCINAMRLTSGSIKVISIYDKPENIYKNYSISQIDGQYLVSPYYGFKLNVEFSISELCLQ